MDTKKKKALVVGGGPAGLTAAGRLAEGGLETVLLEGSSHLGGRAASEWREGFFLNQGPHALYVGGPARRELEAMGIELDWWQPASAASVFPREGKAKRTLGGSAQLGRWFLGLQRTEPEELAGISAAEWLRRSLRSERARASAEALVRVTTFVADQESLSADVAATQLKIGLLPGVRYLRGGWQSLVDALAAKAETSGATLRTRVAARSVQRSADGWTVALDEETLQADLLVVAGGGPDAMAKLLGERAPTAPGPAAELSVLDLALRKLPHRSRRFALGVDKPTYLSRHSPPDQRGGVLLSLASYAREPRTALEELADTVQPGWREQVIFDRFLPRMPAVSAISTPASGGLAGRPAVDRGDGLYLAGDWIGPEGWLVDSAIASGAAAAAAALRSQVPVAA
ncbi:MAG TPA: FAD-dependent oxidoreductase [Solirubrobacterales bacterium]|jgi:phytoene dehydrogenase-like protein|nr:FAD-dependent oxidoreductase [Solirubrobacterales bacterium]